MEETYKVEIIETNLELTKKQRVQLKTNPGTKLDAICPVTIENIIGYARLKINNPSVASAPEYEHFVVVSGNGEMYYTGSQSFMRNFMDIWDEMVGEEDWGIEVYKMDSRKYPGKQFMTCKLV